VSWATILELPAKGGASSFYQSAESRLIHINEPQIIPTLPYNPEATSAASAHSHIRFVMTGALCNDRWQTKRHFRGKSSERASPRLAVSGVPVVEPRALNCVKLCRRGPRMKQCCGATKPFFGAAKTPRNECLIPIKQRGAIMWKPLTLLYREYCRLYRWHCRARVAEIRKYNFTRSA
jgi:hypothetical protein